MDTLGYLFVYLLCKELWCASNNPVIFNRNLGMCARNPLRYKYIYHNLYSMTNAFYTQPNLNKAIAKILCMARQLSVLPWNVHKVF